MCPVRGSAAEPPWVRLDAAFTSGDPELLRRYHALAAEHLEVIGGDIGEADLGLDKEPVPGLSGV
ncbi:hypothetical protein ACH4PU_35070 [Streptomyces sp. NPDC021100]|uniref:hypothetical protein n=1 Tax=Streptomyces sp. NPDC021100 TaxID=3365114 RepID=UPI0037ACA7B7